MAATAKSPNIVQFKNSRTGQYVKYNRAKRRFVESSQTKFAGVPLLKKKAKKKSTTKRKSTKK
jgi:hypothetical protein